MCEEKRTLGYAVGAVLSTMLVVAPASADWTSFEFTGLFHNVGDDSSGLSTELADQFSVLVTMPAADQASFEIIFDAGPHNTGFINRVYWDTHAPRILDTFVSVPDGWEIGATPTDLPEGEDASPTFEAIVSSDTGTPFGGSNPDRITPGESATFTLSLLSGYDWSDLNRELTEGDLRLGLFVAGIDGPNDDDASDHFVSGPPVVPVPGAAGLGLLGLGFVAAFARRRKPVA